MTTVTKALDHLTDVLAGSDVTLKGTKADCIMQLADMIEDGTIVIGGGGGGGATAIPYVETADEGTSTYTLQNAAPIMDALDAVLQADDIASEIAKYTFGMLTVDKCEVGTISCTIGVGGMDAQVASVGIMGNFSANIEDGTITYYVFVGGGSAEVTRSDIDAETGTLTKVVS